MEYINPDFSPNQRPRWLAVVVILICAGIIALTGNRFRESLVDNVPESVQEICDITNQTGNPVPVYVFPYVEDQVIDILRPGETRLVVSSSRLFYKIETAEREKGLVRKEAVKLNGLCRSKR